MRFENLDLNLLVALHAILQERSVTVAAEKTHVTQSSMSGALKRLREYFNDPLFVNHGRRIMLTPRAEELIAPVGEILQFVRARIAVQPHFDHSTSNRRFRIKATDYAVIVLLCDALSEIARLAPNIQFDISPPTEETREQLERGDVDLFIALNDCLGDAHPKAALYEDNLVMVAWEGNTKISRTLSAEQYFDLGHVAMQFSHPKRHAFEEGYVLTARMPRRIEVTACTFGLLGPLLLNTNRVATVHRRLADHFVSYLPLLIYPMPFPIEPITQSVQWHRLQNADQGIQWLVSQLKSAAQRRQPPPLTTTHRVASNNVF